MIRYVIAMFLTVVILGLTFQGIDQSAPEGTEQQIEAELTKIDDAATSLMEEEAHPNQDAPGARRHITLSFPAESMTTASAGELQLRLTDRVGDSRDPVTSVEYVVDGQSPTQTHIEAPIRSPPQSDTDREFTSEDLPADIVTDWSSESTDHIDRNLTDIVQAHEDEDHVERSLEDNLSTASLDATTQAELETLTDTVTEELAVTEHTVSIPQEQQLDLVLWLARDADGDTVVYIDTLSSFEAEYAEQ